MKVLFQSRTTLFDAPGGDTIQVLKTREHLKRMGLDVEISTETEPPLSGYDVVHLFNLGRPQELYLQARNARRKGRKVVLSPIYVDYREYEQQVRTGITGRAARLLKPGQIEYLKVLARAAKNREIGKGTLAVLCRGFRRAQQSILDMADVLLPNSRSELGRMTRDLPAAGEKRFVVVPNAVDRSIFGTVGQEHAATQPERDQVLCVARIEELKNQLNLVRAMAGLPWQLVIIGPPARNHGWYWERIKAEAGPNVSLLGGMEHGQLPRFYRRARVHVLASWMETTGLSSLEAGAMGCNLVITDKGDTREYFDDQAFYCDPGSVESIRAAIIRAYAAPLDAGLRERILRDCTWERAAERTREGYALALAG